MTLPLVPREVDLDGMNCMLLDCGRLLDSDLFALSTPAEFKAAVALWCKSWGQRPPASLTNDDRVLARAASVSLVDWRELRDMALRGWVPCDDGRLYHPVVAEKALEAWIERIAFRKRSAHGNATKAGQVFDPTPFDEAKGRAVALLERIASAATDALADSSIPCARAPPLTRAAVAALKDSLSDKNPSEVEGKGREDIAADAGRAPSRPDLDSLEARLRSAAGQALDAASPSLLVLAPILALTRAGGGPRCEIDLDVLPAVAAVSAKSRAGSVRRWEYFVPAITEARDRRLAGAPAVEKTHERPHRSQASAAFVGKHEDIFSAMATPVLEPSGRRGG